jgi:hypothetical protein
MRRTVKRSCTIIIMCLAVSLVLAACASPSSSQGDVSQGADVRTETFAGVAVIRSHHYSESAFIERLDGALEPLERTELPYAGLENAWGMPTVSDGVIYLVAQGVEGVRDSRIVIGVDLVTGETREYVVDRSALKSVVATERYLFVTNVINDTSTITRVNRQSAETTSVDFTGDFLVGITACGEQLAVLRQPGFDFSGDAELVLLDEGLTPLSVVPLKGLGSATNMTAVGGDTLCFGAYREDAASATQYHNTLHLYSLTTGELRTIAESDYRYGFAAASGEYLVALQSEVNIAEGNRILVFDLARSQSLSEMIVDYMPQHLLAQDDLLYLAGLDQALGSYRLQQYRVGDNGSLSLIAETSLDSAGLPHDGYGISGLVP